MSGNSGKPWSSNLNAPQIPPMVYTAEKELFAGNLISAMLYGVVIVLFFQCESRLLNPVNRTTGGIKWPLVGHTAAMFSFATIYTAMLTLDSLSVSYIDRREYPTGPWGYQYYDGSKAIVVSPEFLTLLNQWLADGLLLYRCCVIYAMNYWVIAFPCLVYLASIAMGIALICGIVTPKFNRSVGTAIDISCFSISVGLNLLLTLMIVARLAVHSKNIRKAMGGSDGAGRLYETIITVLVESCALYSACLTVYIGLYGSGNTAQLLVFPIVSVVQVIAPFLIILRVANRTALTCETVVSGNIGTIHFRSEGTSMDNSGTMTIPDGNPISTVDTADGPGVGVGVAIGEVTFEQDLKLKVFRPPQEVVQLEGPAV